MLVFVWAGYGILLLVGCQDPLGQLSTNDSAVHVGVEPSGSLDAAPRVLRLRIEPTQKAQGRFGVDALELFEDTLSSYYLARVAGGEMPEALAERRVPMLSWRVEPGLLFAQPSSVLDPSRGYTLVAMGYGPLAELTTSQDDFLLLGRVFPEPDRVGGGFGGLYCSDTPLLLEPTHIELAPDQVSALLRPSDRVPERCAVLEVAEPAPVRVLGPRVGTVSLDPAPLVALDESYGWMPVDCGDSCVALAAGCLCPSDDRAMLLTPRAPAFWQLELGGVHFEAESSGGSAVVVPGLVPQTEYSLAGNVYDLPGRETRVALSFRTLEPQVHLAVNEVYANANGPEPAQEWVELVNSGTLPVSLEGYRLEDVGGQTDLPSVTLSPGAYAVVVNADYRPDAELDPVVDPSATLIKVDRLGKNGLSNSGELIRLRAPGGELVSSFPALPASKPGVSMARRDPWSLDDDDRAFGSHATPGASPGAPNELEAK